jgi:exodeoxyribonuclease V alpha subunit
MVLRNDHSLRIYNGDIGILLKQGQEGALSMLMERGGEGFELIPLHLLPRWESAFAITVHKSQGSEYGEALLVLPKQEQRLLTREILYTGVTRAKNRVTLLGDLQLFAKGCTVVAERESGLKERLDLF